MKKIKSLGSIFWMLCALCALLAIGVGAADDDDSYTVATSVPIFTFQSTVPEDATYVYLNGEMHVLIEPTEYYSNMRGIPYTPNMIIENYADLVNSNDKIAYYGSMAAYYYVDGDYSEFETGVGYDTSAAYTPNDDSTCTAVVSGLTCALDTSDKAYKYIFEAGKDSSSLATYTEYYYYISNIENLSTDFPYEVDGVYYQNIGDAVNAGFIYEWNEAGTEADPVQISNAGELWLFLSTDDVEYGQLSADIPYDTDVYGYITVTSNKDLDMNGKTITVPNDVTSKWEPIEISNAIEFTIYGGTFKAGTNTYTEDCVSLVGAYYAIRVTADNAVLNVSNMAFENTYVTGSAIKIVANATANISDSHFDSYFSCAVNVFEGTANITNCIVNQQYLITDDSVLYTCNALSVGNGGTINVIGGTYTSANVGAYVYSSGGIINIEGGTFQGESCALRVEAGQGFGHDSAISTINVYGGTFDGGIDEYGATETQAFINISGGTFSDTGVADIDAFNDAYVTTGYVATQNDDGDYTVTQLGDVDGDGDLDNDDVLLILKLATGAETNESYMARADFNSDGDVNSADAYELYQEIPQ